MEATVRNYYGLNFMPRCVLLDFHSPGINQATSQRPMAKEWDICVDIASTIVELAPERPFGWIGQAYALRRVEGGGLTAAFMTLLLVTDELPAEPMIPFSLSCYTCQMGNLEDARAWLDRAFAVASTTGTKKHLKHMALEEPDLEPLRRKIPQRCAFPRTRG